MTRRTTIAAGLIAAMGINAAAVFLLAVGIAHTGADLLAGRTAHWVALALALTASYALSAAGSWIGSLSANAAAVRLRRATLASILRIDIDVARTVGAGQAQAISMDSEQVGSLLVGGAPAAALGIGQAVVGVGFLLRTGAAHLAVPILVAAGVLGVLAAAALWRLNSRWYGARGELNGALINRLLGSRTVAIQESRDAAGALRDDLFGAYDAAAARHDGASVGLSTLGIVASSALVAVAAVATTGGERGGALGAALLAGVGITRVFGGCADLLSAALCGRRVHQLRAVQRPEQRRRAPIDGPALLTATNVTFAFDGGGGLIHPTSMVVSPGDRILLVGPSGSGKTTLGELLSGHRDPTTGDIACAGGARTVRVPQAGDEHVFHASLLFNVLCGATWPPTEAAVRRAQRLLTGLGLDDLLARMPSGLAQPIGEGGWRLSAGEIARVCVARALAAEPDVLIMDESIAPLDPLTREATIRVAAENSRATVVIAHV